MNRLDLAVGLQPIGRYLHVSVSERRSIEAYRSEDASINEAARIAGVTVAEWLEIAREEGLTYQLSPEELEEDVDSVRNL